MAFQNKFNVVKYFILCFIFLFSLMISSNVNALTKDYNALSFMYNTPYDQTFVSSGLLSYNSAKFNMHSINQLATRIGSSSIPSNANYLSYTGKFNLLTWTDTGYYGYLPEDFGDLKIYAVKIDGVSYNFESANVQRFITNFTCDPLNSGISTNCRTFTYQVSFVLKNIPTSMSNLVVEIVYDNNGTLFTGYRDGFNAYFERDSNNYVSLDFAYDYTSALLQQQISQNDQNTQDIINNHSENTQDIINNQNQNTQDIIRSNQNCHQSVNLFNGLLELGIINGNTGQNQANSSFIRSKDYIPVEELTNYVFSSPSSFITDILVYEYRSDYTYNLSVNKGVTIGSSFKTNAGTRYIRFRPLPATTDTSLKIQFQKGTVPSSYEPYGEEICKNVNEQYYDEQRQADQNISNQSASDIDGATNAQTTNLLGVFSSFLTELQSFTATDCNLTLPFPQFIGGNQTVNICQGKDVLGNFITVIGTLAMVGFYIPLAIVLLKMIYNEIRSFTNG